MNIYINDNINAMLNSIKTQRSKSQNTHEQEMYENNHPHSQKS